MRFLDAHIRRRLRAIQITHWKNGPTIVRNLIARGVKRKTAWATVYDGDRRTWNLSHRSAVDRALNRSFFEGKKLVSLAGLWAARHAPRAVEALLEQLPLFGGGR